MMPIDRASHRRCALLLALTAGVIDCRRFAHGFCNASPLASPSVVLGRGGVVRAALRPQAADDTDGRGCTCAACVAAATAGDGLRRRSPGRKSREGLGRAAFVVLGAEEGDGSRSASAAAASAAVELDNKTVQELWSRVKKQSISVGKRGVKPSHVRSLNSLVKAHTLVKVKINIPNADLMEVGLELAGKDGDGAAEQGLDEDEGNSVGDGGSSSEAAADVSVVTVNANQRTILFANTEFLAAEARGELFNG